MSTEPNGALDLKRALYDGELIEHFFDHCLSLLACAGWGVTAIKISGTGLNVLKITMAVQFFNSVCILNYAYVNNTLITEGQDDI